MDINISWFIPGPFPDQHSYILDTYLSVSKILKNTRIDLANGEQYYGNKIPKEKTRKLFDIILSNTKYKNTFNYIWLKKNPIDILHIQYAYLFPNLISLFKIKNRPKIIFTLRGSDTHCWPWIDKKWRDLYRMHSSNIDAFIVQSSDQQSYLKKFGVQEEKIWIIPAGIKPISYLAKEINRDQKINIISAFRFVWEKNITGNLVFIKMLKERYPNIKYSIFGSGKDLAQIYYLIDRFNISDIVDINDALPNQYLIKKYLEYDYYLQLSISDAGPISVKEAQRCGLIPIVSNIGGLKDIVEDGKTGIIKDLFDYKKLVDDTIKLHQNPESYNTISKQCIENIKKHYTTEIEVKQLKGIYETINGNL